ncbi:MAG: GNAT family protein [Candidatus Saccharimonas sp.]
MTFGPIMEMPLGKDRIRMAPLSSEVMPEYIKDGGMQSGLVTRYLGHMGATVLEDETDWFDRTRKDHSLISWGIYVKISDSWRLIGGTSLFDIKHYHFSLATSGCVIFRLEWWGKGVASTTHRARTWYAFSRLGLHQVNSEVYDVNIGSLKALQSVGYESLYRERNQLFVDGIFHDKISLTVTNPLRPMWTAWWHGDRVPPRYEAARAKTQTALNWALDNVQLV